MKPEERAARRLFMRVARVLIGAVILVALAGAVLWLRAAFHPWTDHDLPDVRARHAVLHLQNETAAPLALAWRRAAAADSAPGPWIDLPPNPALPAGVVESRGYRLLAPLPADAAAAGTPIELRLTQAGDERLLPLCPRAAEHLRLRIDETRALHLQSGRAGWWGAPDFGAELPLDATASAPR